MMPGPIRSEADAFRLVCIVGLAALSIGVLTALTRPLVGSLWGLVLVFVGVLSLLRSWRQARSVERRRVLLVAEGPLDRDAVRAEMAEKWAQTPHEVMVLVPSRHRGCAAALERERQGMELSLQAVKEAGARASGRVVEDDPGPAVTAAYRDFAPHEVVIAGRSASTSSGLREDLLAGVPDSPEVTHRHLVRG